MADFNIDLPDVLGSHISRAVQHDDYASASEFIEHLVQKDFDRHASDAQLRQLIEAGAKSGEVKIGVTAIWLDAVKAKAG